MSALKMTWDELNQAVEWFECEGYIGHDEASRLLSIVTVRRQHANLGLFAEEYYPHVYRKSKSIANREVR